MRKIKTTSKTLALLSTAAIALAACGGSSENSSEEMTESTDAELVKGAAPRVPEAPAGLMGYPLPGEIELVWKAPVLDRGAKISSYNVDMSSDAGTTWTKAGSPQTPTLKVTGLTAGKLYDFRVTAVTSVGVSRPALVRGVKALDAAVTTVPAASATTAAKAALAAPDAPTALKVIPLPKKAELIWTAPVNDGGAAIKDYSIEISSDAGATWSKVGMSPTTKFTMNGLSAGKSYDFKVSAVNSVGVGAASSVASVKLP